MSEESNLMNAKPVDIEASRNLMLSHARSCYPNECVGLIVKVGNKQDVICGRNIAPHPRRTFMLHPEDYGVAEDTGEILALYHSHCEESPNPSMADKVMAEKNGLPVIIAGLTRNADDTFTYHWAKYEPCGWKPDLIGRPFVYGVMDCYNLVQDYYSRELGIELPDMTYCADWNRNGSIFADNLSKNGFVQMKQPQTHDLILMQLETKVPSHVAIYVGDGMMLHHPPGHLSGMHPYVCNRGQYALNTVGFYRHESLLT